MVLANNWALLSPVKQIQKINILSPCFTLPEGMAVRCKSFQIPTPSGRPWRPSPRSYLLSPGGLTVSTSFPLCCLPFLLYLGTSLLTTMLSLAKQPGPCFYKYGWSFLVSFTVRTVMTVRLLQFTVALFPVTFVFPAYKGPKTSLLWASL